MVQWWPLAIAGPFSGQPWDTWFWAQLPGRYPGQTVNGELLNSWGWPGYELSEPITYYWFMKISPSGGHQEQLAIRSPETRTSPQGYTVKADVIYILTYETDTPNWGTASSLVAISPPCGNWLSSLYEVTNEVQRSQTVGLLAAIQAEIDKTCGIIAAVAKTGQLNIGILANIQGSPQLPLGLKAAIRADTSRYLPIRAAIRAERLLEPSIIAAVGKDFELPAGITATIQGNPQIHCHLKAAVLGETEKTVGIVAYVVKSREQAILLEMENLGPQDLDLRSVPNWPSKVKDYRKSSLGPRDS
jgi:hypothetical protein